MPTTSFDKDSIKASIIGKLQRYNGRTIEEASNGRFIAHWLPPSATRLCRNG